MAQASSIPLCKTDLGKIVRFLDDAATVYADMKGTVPYNRMRLIRQLTAKLKQKLPQTSCDK